MISKKSPIHFFFSAAIAVWAGFHAFGAVEHSGALPEGYRQLEFIQGDGKTAYFETDFTPCPSTDKIEAVVSVSDWLADLPTVFMAWASNAANAWGLFLRQSGGFRFDYGNESVKTAQPRLEMQVGVPYVFTIADGVLTCSGGIAGETKPTPFAGNAGGVMRIFAYKTGAVGHYGTHRLHSLKIWRNDTLIHDLVPALDEQGAATLVDVCDSPLTLTRYGTFASDLTVADIEPQPCPAGGQDCRPRVVVRAGYGAKLREGVDYTLAYANNTKSGLATATVTGIGAHAGKTASVRFAILPADKKRVEWMQGDGLSAYVETGFTPYPARDKVEAVVSIPNWNESNHSTIFWATTKGLQNGWGLLTVKNGGFWFPYGTAETGGKGDQSRTMADDMPYAFTIQNYSIVCSGGIDGQVKTSAFASDTAAAGGPIVFFAYNYSTGFSGHGTHKLHSFKVWRDGVLIHEFVPVIDENKDVTLFDASTEDAALTLTRHGSFTAGPIVKSRLSGMTIIFL